MSSEFYGYYGAREVLTFITEGEKSPSFMGFSMSDEAVAAAEHERVDEMFRQDPEILAPEDEIHGEEISEQHDLVPVPEGKPVPSDAVAVEVADFDKVVVNGVELTVSSTLAAFAWHRDG